MKIAYVFVVAFPLADFSWPQAQLKINLRPLWSPASAALGLLSERFGDLVWKLLFTELCMLGEGGREDANPHWMQETGQDNTNSTEDPWEEERTWRDPSAHKIRSVVQERWDSEFSQKQLLKVNDYSGLFVTMTYCNPQGANPRRTPRAHVLRISNTKYARGVFIASRET